MNLIKNLSFRKKLLALIVPPILGTILFSGLNLNNAIQEKSVVDQITPLVELSISSSLIVHELQKERGATAGFVGSKGKSFKDTLAKQRQDTNAVLNREVKHIQEIGNSIKTKQPQVYSDLNRVITIIDSLSKLRSQVDQLALSAPNSAKFYTDLNAAMLSLSGSIANISTQGELTTKLRNYYTFMQAKEAAGQERAILNIALSHGAFPVGIYQKVVTLNAYQNAYLKTFEQFATKAQITNLNKIHSSSDGVRVEEIRQIANKKYIEGNFGVTGQEWFTVSTNRINLMKNLEDQLAGNIHDVVSGLENKANNAIFFSFILILFILLLTFALTIIISKLLIGQALQLTKTIDDVSQARDLSLRARIQSTDELGTGAKSFNDMLTGFGNMLSNIEANSIQLATAAEQTSVSISENAKSLEKQSHETAQAAASTEEMTATVNEIAQSTVMTAESANHAALLSTEGVTAVESNAHNMSKLNEQISDANVQVVKLRNSSKEISEIVDVIKSIADQTNLLALNAAIEAARAGESGRGFAVVADEVRTLAQRTQESTQKIEDMVGRFQSEADGVSKSIESSFTHVKASREQTISVKDKLTEINNAIESIKDMSNQVATAAEEQVAATSEIAKNIRTISDLAEEGANTGEQISKAAQEQTELCSQQHDLVAMFTLKR